MRVAQPLTGIDTELVRGSLDRQDAGRWLAEVMPALLAALGVPGPAPALAVPPVRAAVLLLVDGLGSELLRRYADDAPFLASLPDSGPLTAGFPSSTSISLASIGTGVPPCAATAAATAAGRRSATSARRRR